MQVLTTQLPGFGGGKITRCSTLRPAGIWSEPDSGARRSACYGNWGPVGAPAGGARDGPGGVIVGDAVHPSGNGVDFAYVVTAGGEPGSYLAGNDGFDFQLLALGPYPGSFNRFLQGHSVVDKVDDSLQYGGKDAHAAGGAQRAATAASMAFPPRANICAPAAEPIG